MSPNILPSDFSFKVGDKNKKKSKIEILENIVATDFYLYFISFLSKFEKCNPITQRREFIIQLIKQHDSLGLLRHVCDLKDYTKCDYDNIVDACLVSARQSLYWRKDHILAFSYLVDLVSPQLIYSFISEIEDSDMVADALRPLPTYKIRWVVYSGKNSGTAFIGGETGFRIVSTIVDIDTALRIYMGKSHTYKALEEVAGLKRDEEKTWDKENWCIMDLEKRKQLLISLNHLLSDSSME